MLLVQCWMSLYLHCYDIIKHMLWGKPFCNVYMCVYMVVYLSLYISVSL